MITTSIYGPGRPSLELAIQFVLNMYLFIYNQFYPLYTDTRNNDSFLIMTIWMSQNLSSGSDSYGDIMHKNIALKLQATYVLDIC